MRKLIAHFKDRHKVERGKQNKLKIDLPPGFEEVILSQQTGWDYWQVVTQPAWFIERYGLYASAKGATQSIINQLESSKVKKKWPNK